MKHPEAGEAGPAGSAGRGGIVLLVLCVSVVLSMATWFSATAVMPELRAAWGLGGAEATWLTNGVQIGFVTGALAASLVNLPDIVRLNRLMAGSAAVAGIANGLLLLDPGPWGAVACRIATGMALAGVYPPAMKLVATWFERNRGFALGAVVGALTLGSSLPHLFRALAADPDWRLVIFLASLAALLAAAVFLRFAREGPYPFGRAVFRLGQVGLVLRDRDLLLVNLGYFGHMWELYAMWAWLLIFLREAGSGGLSAGAASLLTFVAVGSGLLGCLLGGLLSDRFGRTLTTSGLMLVSGLCCLAAGFVFDGPLWLTALLAIVWGVAIVGDSPLFSASVTELANRDLVGTALSLQMGCGFALTVVAISLLPEIAGALGSWRWTFLFLAPGPAIGIWAMLRLRTSPAARRLAGGRR